ncbi:MAG: AAA family ATPase [bacterium]
MIQRHIKIKNFRNIGENRYEKFTLNSVDNKKTKLGGIVTLIGMNNTGKSNFLDALNFLDTKKLTQSDVPYFNYDSTAETSIVLWLKDYNEEDDSAVEYQYKIKKDSIYIEKFIDGKVVKQKNSNSDKTKIKFNADMMNIIQHMGDSNVFNKITRIQKQNNNNNVEIPFNNDVDRYTESIQNILHQNATVSEYQELLKFLKLPIYKEIVRNHFGFANFDQIDYIINQLVTSLKEFDKNPILEEVKKNYNTDLIPNIIKYDDTISIKQKDTTSNVGVNGLDNPMFFKILFNLLNKRKYEELETAYKKFFATPTSIHFLSNFQNIVNKELEKLAETFNKIYGYSNEKQYGFKLKLESSKVYFVLSENGSDVPYEGQSTGFRWFFNFFFNVFANEDLKNGDIVILDEPATNLHVSGQIELRKQIKKFGLDNGITFVLSTHSPFLIDVDYLDEIRVVSKEGLYSVMENKFSVSDKKIIDVLMPIQSSLTVGRHIINDPNKTLIFVEGITDYNYLVAFKEHLKYDNLTFLPIQGIKETEKVFVKLQENFTNPIILVDSDYYGQKAKQKSTKQKHYGIEIREINEINEKFKYIEDLFTNEDKEKFVPEKSYDRSTHFKNHFQAYKSKLSKQTIQNFKSLFETLSI